MSSCRSSLIPLVALLLVCLLHTSALSGDPAAIEGMHTANTANLVDVRASVFNSLTLRRAYIIVDGQSMSPAGPFRCELQGVNRGESPVTIAEFTISKLTPGKLTNHTVLEIDLDRYHEAIRSYDNAYLFLDVDSQVAETSEANNKLLLDIHW